MNMYALLQCEQDLCVRNGSFELSRHILLDDPDLLKFYVGTSWENMLALFGTFQNATEGLDRTKQSMLRVSKLISEGGSNPVSLSFAHVPPHARD